VIRDVAGNFMIFDAQQDKESITIGTAYRNNWWVIGHAETPD
jgi:hypothetical protein